MIYACFGHVNAYTIADGSCSQEGLCPILAGVPVNQVNNRQQLHNHAMRLLKQGSPNALCGSLAGGGRGELGRMTGGLVCTCVQVQLHPHKHGPACMCVCTIPMLVQVELCTCAPAHCSHK